MENGPSIQSGLFDIVIRFCIHRVAFTADISKMYRRIGVHQEDVKYQQILIERERRPITGISVENSNIRHQTRKFYCNEMFRQTSVTN